MSGEFINNFNWMEVRGVENPRANEYLSNLLDQHAQTGATQSISDILKQKEHHVVHKLKEGEL